jgi:hypothetical protein
VRITADANVKDGQLLILDKETFLKRIAEKYEGQVITLTAEKPKNTISGAQQRYLWGVVYKMLSEGTEYGYTPDEWHDMMKAKFRMRFKEVVGPNGKVEELAYAASTAKMPMEEFNEYKENIQRWASIHLKMVIPDPNQTSFLQEEEQ